MLRMNGEWGQFEDEYATKSATKWLWLSVFVVVADQITKFWASHRLELYEPLSVMPMVNFTLIHNTGAAFSLLNEAGGWQRWLFVFLALAVSLFIAYWLTQLTSDRHWFACALALILGGAVGNLWDRLTHGYVIDFIDVYYGDWHWPAFNVADSAITVGALMLLLDALKKDEEDEETPE